MHIILLCRPLVSFLREHILEISVINRTTLRDDLVGTTHIDVEDRWRTQHRATVGIANEYSKYIFYKFLFYFILPLYLFIYLYMYIYVYMYCLYCLY